ncbi:hypothetical protein BDP27DRAFT_1370280 [Rhodocollybia butyracea]|uniref:Uncharacterized protein n=1 Tax=Rhodocollybia butyracea TaxID=206335 RepID=A0A9P5TYQ2_9AGAR|nr:hypothetical protein BDP27DRAFT_1370280 [Rhodocollybia butyracea]
MPPGTPFSCFALPYPIRIDGFSAIPSDSYPQNPALHLLPLVDTKSTKSAPFSKENIVQSTFIGPDGELLHAGARDLLKVFPLNTPTSVELEDGKEVIITLFDANHSYVHSIFHAKKELSYIQETSEQSRGSWIPINKVAPIILETTMDPLSTPPPVAPSVIPECHPPPTCRMDFSHEQYAEAPTSPAGKHSLSPSLTACITLLLVHLMEDNTSDKRMKECGG